MGHSHTLFRIAIVNFWHRQPTCQQ